MNEQPVSIPVPEPIRNRAAGKGTNLPERLTGVGNSELLNTSLLGLLASRSCPGKILLQTIDRVPEWIESGWTFISGFHSPLEQQTLRSILRRGGRVVKLLARGMGPIYRAAREENAAISAGNMLIVTTFPRTMPRITRETALERNRLVLAIAEKTCIPWVEDGSPLKKCRSESLLYGS
jgi:predicted Rossmann fold nucleotide-binding protein DprA/Smf involved in DNA uptake